MVEGLFKKFRNINLKLLLAENKLHKIVKNIIKLEELAKFVFAYSATLYMDYSWWVFLAWLFAPDLSMIGYLVNTKVGAVIYNFFHHQALAIAVGITGLYLANTDLQFAGLVLFGHSALDRALGYGLKYDDHFKNTHLGWIGKENSEKALK
jgi:xanthine/uracil/vitamin C permease (AzgA family)